jgi:hyperosmotically inducible periplasmic protein
MTITTNKICSLGSAALLAVTLAVTGCRTGRDRTAGQAINDKMTAFNVNHALNSDPVLKFPDVKVNVYNGNAQLTGFVNTDEQRAKAAEIAANVQGISQVINEISIKPTPTGRAPIRDPLHGEDRNLPPPNNPPPPPR